MSHTKTPRRPGRALPTEVKTLVPGHARGDAAFIAMRRKGSLWAVVDSNRGDWTPDYWDGREWAPLTVDTPAAKAYRWPHDEARDLMRRFAVQAAEIESHYIGLMDAPEPAEEEAEPEPAASGPESAKPDARATIPASHRGNAEEGEDDPSGEDEGVSVPAPADVEGSCFAKPDMPEVEPEPEGLRVVADTPPGPVDSEAASVSEETQAVDMRVLRERMGLDETTQIPVIPGAEDDTRPIAAVRPLAALTAR